MLVIPGTPRLLLILSAQPGQGGDFGLLDEGAAAARNNLAVGRIVVKQWDQIADAEALLDIANAFVTSVRSQSSEGITPSDFVTAVLKKFG
ncbi:hypothetical protein GUJ93_ZPchr0002g23330 [Zizania palustris]|uniref:Uncharacterized protein n=1 Tax=Zizania palustris TaxID=103762 RepID=A0A8J5VWM2_ZIZPA|nr:hypothetical protein GUJ93_ZPchr0002g23330 [Zizania palustris]